MKVRLLKKLRKDAYKRIGMLYFVDSHGNDTYNIGFRSGLTTDYACDAHIERTLESAKRRLAWYRQTTMQHLMMGLKNMNFGVPMNGVNVISMLTKIIHSYCNYGR